MKEKQLIYVTLDLRRAMWVAETTGAKIVCSYKSDLLSKMRENGADIWCFEEEYPDADVPQSTFLLLSRALTLNMLRDLNKTLSFVVFKPSNKLKNWAEKEVWSIISANVAICRQLEDKVEFRELAEKYKLIIPKNLSVTWDLNNLDKYHEEFGDKFIVQGRMGHAGNNTYIIREKHPKDSSHITSGTRVKISEFVEGKSYTVNGYVDPLGKLAISPVWEQMTHVKEWNSFEFGTVGVSPVEHLPQEAYEKLSDEIKNISPLFHDISYSGFFGLDYIWNGEKWFLIECNPRLTATVSLQCLVDTVHNRIPILKLHSEKAKLDGHRFDFLDIKVNHFGQIILRNTLKRVWKVPKTLKSGIYEYGNDHTWKLLSRDVDARNLEENQILLILSRNPSDTINPGSDFASLQFLSSCFDESGNIEDRFFDFYEKVILARHIRESEIWENRFVRIDSSEIQPIFLFRKPINDPRAKALKLSSRLIQCEVAIAEVLKLLGQHNSHYLVERSDGTRGWLPQNVSFEENNILSSEWIMPNKSTKTSSEYFEYWISTPYRLGGNSKNGIDCSAFVQRYFWEVKGVMLPKYSQDQKSVCSTEITEKELINDDLVFMHSKTKPCSHVGVFFNGKVWHSSLETGVICQSLGLIKNKYFVETFLRYG